MDLSKLTLQELRESRDDLVQTILTEADATRSGHPEKIKALEAHIKTLQEALDGYQAAEARRALQEAIAGELKAAGLDPADKTQLSEVFLEDLHATADPVRRKAKIDDRKQLVLSRSAVAPTTGSPLQEAHDGAAIPPASAPLAQRIARFAR